MRRLSCAALALGLGGCVDFGDADAHVPGDPLGEYRVSAELDESSCGDGALGTAASWQFDVRLSRDGRDLFWLNGTEVIPGRIGSDGSSFELGAELEVVVDRPDAGRPGCTVVRSDHAVGRLRGADLDVSGFEATLAYGYRPAPGSDCSSLLGMPGGLAQLPCEMQFALDAQRSDLTSGGD